MIVVIPIKVICKKLLSLILCWKKQVKEKLASENCQIKVNCEVHLVSTSDKGGLLI